MVQIWERCKPLQKAPPKITIPAPPPPLPPHKDFSKIPPPPIPTKAGGGACHGWSKMFSVKLPGIMSGSIAFENILPIRVLEWLVLLVGCKIKGINELQARESKDSFVVNNDKF